MSVPKYRRTGSQLDCYDRAQALQIAVLKDLPTIISNTVLMNKSMDSDKLLARQVEKLQDDMHALVCDILHANAINPQYEWEVAERRKFQDHALGDCMSVQNDLLTLATLWRDTLQCLLHYATEAQEVERMVRSWRKYNNEIVKRIRSKEGAYSRNPGNFCNTNSNGNSSNNDAGTVNGVRPD